MAIAGAVVVPIGELERETLLGKLKELKGVTIEGIGPRGIAIVLEGESNSELETLSKKINDWDEVLIFELVYLNWEEDEEICLR